MRNITALVIHCSDTYARMDTTVEDIRRWHVQERKWSDIGYHFVIERSGTVRTGRNLATPGAHVAGHNAKTLGICMVGGRGDDDQPEENFTIAQWQALDILVDDLLDDFPNADVIGHRDLTPHKACPAFDVKDWFASR